MVTHMNRGETKYFEDMEAGKSWVVEDARTITESDVTMWCSLTGDWGRIHVSKPYAEGTVFGQRVVPGNLVAAIAEPIGLDWSGEAFSYGHDNTRFIKPVYIGDTITVKTEIIECSDYDDLHGRVIYKYEVYNQDEELVMVDEHITLVTKRAAADQIGD